MTNKHPRLRVHTRKGKAGQVWTTWTYDQRPHGPEISLGSDYDKALAQWDLLYNKKPLVKGRVQEAINRWRDECLPKYTNAKTRKDYSLSIAKIEPVFGPASWFNVTIPILRAYLDQRPAKTQGNRELSLLSVIWARARMWGMTDLIWPATGVRNWKNQEAPRHIDFNDVVYEAIYKQADQVLRDCMDLATTTGMRLADARTCLMPVDDKLRFKAGKTGKWAYFEVSKSPVLTALLERRGNVDCVMLLTTITGRQVSADMLRSRYEKARELAAIANPKMAAEIRAIWLRDCRKRAADLADNLDAASALLQHSNKAITAAHYTQKPTKLVSVR